MKLENFLLADDSIALEYEGNYLDLHNNYNFTNLSYDVRNQRVELKWTKSQGKWAKKEIYEELKMIFNSVAIFILSPRDTEVPFLEDECLDYIGYLHPEDIDIMNGFLPREFADDSYHLVLGFQSDLSIKIYSNTVRLVVNKKGK